MPAPESNTFTCAHCQANTPNNEQEFIEHNAVCTGCWSDFWDEHTRCAWCDNITHIDDARYDDDQYESYCPRCFDDFATTCGCCSQVWFAPDGLEFGDGNLCSTSCAQCCGANYRNSDIIRPWRDRPSLKFINDVSEVVDADTYYLGMEIEIEGEGTYDVSVEASPEFPNLWVSTDGSLDTGYEWITHPGTFAAWMSGNVIDWGKWTRLVHEAVEPQEWYDTNGIHIHVSRNAFRNSGSHLYRWMQFIQAHPQAVALIAGRGDAAYCRWDYSRDTVARKKDAKGDRGSDRYRPINVQNDQTIEVRIFDGLTDPTHMKRALQFVHSTIEYTRNTHGLGQWSDYTEYVSSNGGLYHELLEFLQGESSVELAATTDTEWRKEMLEKVASRKKRAIYWRRTLDNVNQVISSTNYWQTSTSTDFNALLNQYQDIAREILSDNLTI